MATTYIYIYIYIYIYMHVCIYIYIYIYMHLWQCAPGVRLLPLLVSCDSLQTYSSLQKAPRCTRTLRNPRPSSQRKHEYSQNKGSDRHDWGPRPCRRWRSGGRNPTPGRTATDIAIVICICICIYTYMCIYIYIYIYVYVYLSPSLYIYIYIYIYITYIYVAISVCK